MLEFTASPQIIVTPPLEATVRLLEDAGLPASDIDAASLEHFLAGYSQGELVGIVGLQPFGTDALLRSLVVAAAARGAGVGRALVHETEARACALGIRCLYLLTTTAEAYFRRLGYRPCAREQAPESIRATREFSELCPDDAAFMCKSLDPRPAAA